MSKMKTKILNEWKLWIFSAGIGAFSGAVLWTFLKIMSLGIELLWDTVPSALNIPFYTLIVCTLGGLIIGLVRKRFGDYPEELGVVFGKLKMNKTYEYRNMAVLLITALLPLIFGSSVGPEAGMTGVIVGLCCWAGDNLKLAGKNSREYSQIGAAVTLSVLFRSPLFGFFTVKEDEDLDDGEDFSLSRSSKILLYGLAIAAGAGVYMSLSALFGAGLGGFPSFTASDAGLRDYIMIIVYIACGCVLAGFYYLSHKAAAALASKIPAILREVLGGLCLGIVGTFIPAMMFSGEEQMGELMEVYTDYLPVMLIGAAFLKVLLTNVCIQSGLKGGHFFPVIFAGVCLGYGIAMLIFPSGGHEVFGAAVTVAAVMGGIMKKPLAVTVLLFLCFPIRMFLWIFLAAAVGAKVFSFGDNKPIKNKG